MAFYNQSELLKSFPEYRTGTGFKTTLDWEKVYASKYVFKEDIGDNGEKLTIMVDDLEKFEKDIFSLPAEKRCFYEMIRRDRPVKEFYDIDYKPERELSKASIRAKEQLFIDHILSKRNKLVSTFLAQLESTSGANSPTLVTANDYIILSASVPRKVSLHLISKNSYFENMILHKRFSIELHSLIEGDKPYPINIDTAVYGKDQCFRLIGSCKRGKDNPLTGSPGSALSLQETIIQRIDTARHERIDYVPYEMITDSHDDRERGSVGVTSRGEKEFKNYSSLEEFVNEKADYFVIIVEDEKRGSGRLDRKGDKLNITTLRRRCLCDPDDYHSTENMFWYTMGNGDIAINCFCGKGSTIIIKTSRLTDSGSNAVAIEHGSSLPLLGVTTPWLKERRDTALRIPNQRVLTYPYIQALPPGFSEMDSNQIIIDTRITGRGKTYQAMNIARNFSRVLVVHHRLSLDTDYQRAYPHMTSYHDDPKADKLTCCVNSLFKIKDWEKYEIIIFDEITSILKQLTMKSIICNWKFPNVKDSIYVMFALMKKQVPRFYLDANMLDSDIKYILSLSTGVPLVLHEPVRDCGKDVYLYDNLQDIIRLIRDERERQNEDPTSRKRIIIAHNISIDRMKAILRILGLTNPRTLHIHRENKLDNVPYPSEEWHLHYDVICYSPTVAEGVSWNMDEWADAKAFVFASNMSSPATSVNQMVGRFRKIKTIHIGLEESNFKKSGLFRSYEELRDACNNTIVKMSECGNCTTTTRIIEDEVFKHYARVKIEEAYEYDNYREVLIQRLIDNGYRIRIVQTRLSKDYQRENTKTKREIARVTKVVRSDAIEGLLDDKSDDGMEKKKALAENLNIEVEALTPDIIKRFDKPGVKHALILLRMFLTPLITSNGVEIIKDRLKKKSARMITSLDDDRVKNYIDQNPFIKMEYPKLIKIENELKAMGYSGICDNKGIPTPTIAPQFATKEGKKLKKEALDLLRIKFESDGENTFQVIDLPLRAYGDNSTPSLFGNKLFAPLAFPLGEEEPLFVRGKNKCIYCAKKFAKGMTLTHLNSKRCMDRS
jgi:hypothetical protein